GNPARGSVSSSRSVKQIQDRSACSHCPVAASTGRQRGELLVQHATASWATARLAADLARAELAEQAPQDWPTLAAPLVRLLAAAWAKDWASATATASLR